MQIEPAARVRSTHARERRRRAAARWRDGRHLEAAAQHHLARWPAVHLGRRQVHRGRDQRPELQPGEHGRLRSDHVGGDARSADRDRALPRGLRTLRAAVHPRLSAQAPAARGATSIAPATTIARSSAPVRIASVEWKTGEYILLERVPTYWRGTPKIAGCSSSSCRTPTRGSISSSPARCIWWRRCRGTSTASWRWSRASRSIARRATPTSTSRSINGGSPPSETFAFGGR